MYNLTLTTHPALRIRWFTRHPLRYAEERDGWIFRDNTGLKGEVATWARKYLEDGALDAPDSPLARVVTKIDTAARPNATEASIMQRELPVCDQVVQAVGYTRNELPRLTLRGVPVDLKYRDQQGGFDDAKTGEMIPGLYGAGIAWPEKVLDPEGRTEFAVGLWKFMRYLKKVVPNWAG